MVWEGKDAVKTGRVLLGATNPLASAPGTSESLFSVRVGDGELTTFASTVRGDFAIDVGRNVCHGVGAFYLGGASNGSLSACQRSALGAWRAALGARTRSLRSSKELLSHSRTCNRSLIHLLAHSPTPSTPPSTRSDCGT
jgi:hypothetical protein